MRKETDKKTRPSHFTDMGATMDLTAEAIEKILTISEPRLVALGEHHYSDKQLKLVLPPKYVNHELHALGGLMDLFERLNRCNDKNQLMVVVSDHGTVLVRVAEYDDHNDSPVMISCTLVPVDPFPFNRFLPAEEFCIRLLTLFEASDDLHALYRLAASLTASAVTISEDDGISQKTTVKKGVATRAEENIRPVWTLKPYRTFMEIEQPPSPFLFRLKADKDQVPHSGLFETDGGRWKLDARVKIQAYLRARLGDTVLIVA